MLSAGHLGVHPEVRGVGAEGRLGDRPRPREPSGSTGCDREGLLGGDHAPVKSVRPVGAGVPDDAAGARRGIDGQLGARAEDAPLRHAAHPFAFEPIGRSVRQAFGCLSHRGDRPPYPEPGGDRQLSPILIHCNPLCGAMFGRARQPRLSALRSVAQRCRLEFLCRQPCDDPWPGKRSTTSATTRTTISASTTSFGRIRSLAGQDVSWALAEYGFWQVSCHAHSTWKSCGVPSWRRPSASLTPTSISGHANT